MAFLDFTGLSRFFSKLSDKFADKSTFTRSNDGLVPHPTTTTTTRYLREDMSWQVPPNTTYNLVSTAANGLAPKLSGNGNTFLNGNGSYTIPPDTVVNNVAFATCDTAAATAAKVATISGNNNWNLVAGAIVGIKFTYSNTASNVTINVNNTGAKSIWYAAAAYTSTSATVCGTANRTIFYMYDGTYWRWISHGSEDNTTYSNASLGQGYGTCDTAAATVAKVVTLANYALTLGGIVAVKFTYDVPAKATMNINSKGAKNIFHRGAAITAGIINGGDIATFIYDGTQYHLLAIDNDQNTEYSSFTRSADGLVPHPTTTTTTRYLREDGSWQVPPDNNTTYGVVSTTANGLAPKLSGSSSQYLNGSGSWSTPPNTVINNVAYATCTTAAATAAKEATIVGNSDWTLQQGAIVTIKFTNSNTASNTTLNVNGTGAKQIWYNNAVYTAASSTVSGYANRYTTYVYDGTYWVWLSYGTDSNTTYTPASLGFGYGTCPTAEATAAKLVTLANYVLVTGGIISVLFTYAVPANATLNVNSRGAKNINHRGARIAAGIIKAGDVATFVYDGTQYQLISVDPYRLNNLETHAIQDSN